jgi:hypothetical protein
MKLFKVYLKKDWWWPLIYAIPVVFMNEGYVYPELRFEFDFLSEPWTYVSFIFHYTFWSIGWFFLFWKPNYLHQKKKTEEKTLPK